MNNDSHFRTALVRLEELKAAVQIQPIHRVANGNGPYALRAVFPDGASAIKVYGFATVDDAELFRQYVEAIPDQGPQRLQTPFGVFVVGGDSTEGHAERLEIVRIVQHLEIAVGPERT